MRSNASFKFSSELANENLKHDLSTLSDQAFLKKLNIQHKSGYHFR